MEKWGKKQKTKPNHNFGNVHEAQVVVLLLEQRWGGQFQLEVGRSRLAPDQKPRLLVAVRKFRQDGQLPGKEQKHSQHGHRTAGRSGGGGVSYPGLPPVQAAQLIPGLLLPVVQRGLDEPLETRSQQASGQGFNLKSRPRVRSTRGKGQSGQMSLTFFPSASAAPSCCTDVTQV